MKKVLFIDHVNRILGGAEINLIELLQHPPLYSDWHIGCAVSFQSPLYENLQACASNAASQLNISFFDYELDSGLNEMRVVGKHPLAPIKKAISGYKALKNAQKLLSEIVERFQPDVIISIPNKDHLVASPICREKNILHIWWVNDIVSQDFFPWLARNAFYRTAKKANNHFATVSQFASNALIESGIPAPRVHTVHNGIPLKNYQATDSHLLKSQQGIDSDTFTFGVVGRWCQWKGQDHFLMCVEKWIHKFPDENVKFLIIGRAFNEDAEFELKLKDKAKKLNESFGKDFVLFVPFQKNISMALSGLDCLLHTSTKPEPFGRVIIESMACKTPVIGARDGAVPEIISHEKTGLLAQAGSVDDYITCMERIYNETQLRSSITTGAFEWVEQKFSIERVFQDFKTIIGDN